MADHLNNIIRNTADFNGNAGARTSTEKTNPKADAEKMYEDVVRQVNASNLQGAARDKVLDRARSDLNGTADLNRVIALVSAQIDKEILNEKDAEDTQQQRQEILAMAAENREIEAMYAKIRLSAAAHRRAIITVGPLMTDRQLREFTDALADEKAPKEIQQFQSDASFAAFKTESGQAQLKEYNKLDPAKKLERAEQIEKVKVLVDDLSKQHPTGPIHDLMSKVEHERAFSSKEMYDAVGKLAAHPDSKEAMQGVEQALAHHREHKAAFRNMHSDQARAVVHKVAGGKLDNVVENMSKGEVEKCSKDMQDSGCRVKAEKKLQEAIKTGSVEHMTTEEKKQVAVLAMEKGLEANLQVDDIIKDLNRMNKELRQARGLETHSDAFIERSVQLSSITGSKIIGIKMPNSHVSAEDRIADTIKAIKGQDKYKGHKWTEAEDKALHESTKKTIEGIDNKTLKVDKIDITGMLFRGAGIVLDNDDKGIDKYAGTVNKALIASGYSKEFSDNVTSALKTVGHLATATGVSKVTHSVREAYHDAKVSWNLDDDIGGLVNSVRKSTFAQATTKDGKKLLELTGDKDKDIDVIEAVLKKANVDMSKMDKDKDGHIRGSELGAALAEAQKVLGAKTPEQWKAEAAKVEQDKLDHKADIKNNLGELAKVKIVDAKGKTFNPFDLDKSGMISVGEISNAFKKANVDLHAAAGKDGVLSEAEMKAAIQQAAKNLQKMELATAKADHHAAAPATPNQSAHKKTTQVSH